MKKRRNLPRARGLRREAGVMNKTEKAYSEHLEALKGAGAIAEYWFEPFNLRLAPKCYYKPDFLVQDADGYLEVHEVKGFFEPDAIVRVKTAAEKFPFKFVVIKKKKKKEGGGWAFRYFGGQDVRDE